MVAVPPRIMRGIGGSVEYDGREAGLDGLILFFHEHDYFPPFSVSLFLSP